jgi:hypothetical protein
MRVVLAASAAPAAQGIARPQAVECSFPTLASIAPVGGVDVSDGRIRLGMLWSGILGFHFPALRTRVATSDQRHTAAR